MNEINTYRESEYSWNQKSKLDYDDEDLILGSVLHNSSHTQDMIKDYLDSESLALNTERNDNEKTALKEEIDNTRDKIFRSIEEYKNLVSVLQESVDTIEQKCSNLDEFEEEIEVVYDNSKQIFPQFDEHNWERFECNLQIDVLEAKLYEQGDE